MYAPLPNHTMAMCRTIIRIHPYTKFAFVLSTFLWLQLHQPDWQMKWLWCVYANENKKWNEKYCTQFGPRQNNDGGGDGGNRQWHLLFLGDELHENWKVYGAAWEAWTVNTVNEANQTNLIGASPPSTSSRWMDGWMLMIHKSSLTVRPL